MSKKIKTETDPYDAAEFLRTDEDCALYLQAVMEEDGVTECRYRAQSSSVRRNSAAS